MPLNCACKEQRKRERREKNEMSNSCENSIGAECWESGQSKLTSSVLCCRKARVSQSRNNSSQLDELYHTRWRSMDSHSLCSCLHWGETNVIAVFFFLLAHNVCGLSYLISHTHTHARRICMCLAHQSHLLSAEEKLFTW
jgi:hypothetical protein